MLLNIGDHSFDEQNFIDIGHGEPLVVGISSGINIASLENNMKNVPLCDDIKRQNIVHNKCQIFRLNKSVLCVTDPITTESNKFITQRYFYLYFVFIKKLPLNFNEHEEKIKQT